MGSKVICMNCSAIISRSASRTGNLFFRKTKLSVQEALCSLYQLPRDFLDSEQNEVLCCKRCTSILEEMYHLFTQFQALQNENSRLRKIIMEEKPHFAKGIPLQLKEHDPGEDEVDPSWDKSSLSPEDFAVPSCSENVTDSEPEETVPVKIKTKAKAKKTFKMRLKVSEGKIKSKDKKKSPDHYGKVKPKRKRLDKNKKPICELCNEEFPNWTILKKHLRSVHRQELFTCDKCEKQFQQNRSLERHKMTHEGIKTQICHLCGKPFLHKDDLHKHLKLHKINETLPNIHHCGECNVSFRTQKLLLEHHTSVNHEDSKPFKCKICNLGYDRIGSLRRHEQLHVGNVARPFKCEQCSKTFGHKINLRNHIATVHTLGKDEADALLGISTRSVPAFIEGEQLSQNIMECTECMMSFNSLRELQRHVEGTPHADGKPLKCAECGAGFLSAHGRKIHFKVRHSGCPQLSFKCCVCERVISNKNAYRVHLVKLHKMTKEEANIKIQLTELASEEAQL